MEWQAGGTATHAGHTNSIGGVPFILPEDVQTFAEWTAGGYYIYFGLPVYPLLVALPLALAGPGRFAGRAASIYPVLLRGDLDDYDSRGVSRRPRACR